MSEKSCTGTTLQILLVFMLLAGIAIIVVALVLETPPSTLPLYGMIVIGSLQILCSLLGCVTTCYQRCCQTLFIILYLFAWVPLVILTVAMFVHFDGVVDEVDKRIDDSDRKDLEDKLKIVRYVFVVICAIELFGLIMGCLRLLSIRGEMDVYSDMDRPNNRSRRQPKRTNFLSALRKDIEMGKKDGDKESEYTKIKRRIQDKYGKSASDIKSRT
eukprot:TRINITY_DN4272_c0_g1_i1.p1 TRINITY_DN4272_c0_g1~~TRINITY_DN4272_c0_g1_i1.p1  ORF type:complete len:215 (+),score=9.69 TRINITY_DN4272_c0_g1_i1:330-974(+)